MPTKRIFLALAGSALLALGTTAAASAKTIDVVASFGILADVVKNVGGEHTSLRE